MKKNNLEQIVKRLERLERSVFGKSAKIGSQTRKLEKNFSGLKGGILYLVSHGFFKSRKKLLEIRNELQKHDYHYKAGAVQTTLNRLSKRGGPLTAFSERGNKVYVRRK